RWLPTTLSLGASPFAAAGTYRQATTTKTVASRHPFSRTRVRRKRLSHGEASGGQREDARLGGLHDPASRSVQGSGGQQRLGGLCHHAAGDPAAAPDGHRRRHLRAERGGSEVVADIEADRAVGGELEAVLVGRVHLD